MEDVETLVPDLTDFAVDEPLPADLEPFLDVLYGQVERPRWNLGGSGPPGRAD